MERLEEVEALQEALRQKDEDLKLAAEVGNSLLLANQKLEAKLTKLERRLQESNCGSREDVENTSPQKQQAKDDDKHILLLERLNTEFRKQLDAQTRELEETRLQSQTQLKQISDHLNSLQTELSLSNERNSKLECEVDQLQKRNSLLQASARQSAGVVSTEESETLIKRLGELETENIRLQLVNKELNQMREMLRVELEEARRESETFRAQVDELDQMRVEQEQQMMALGDAQEELVQARETIHQLSEQLAVYLPKQDQPADAGNKTLFSEVEDKRVVLENEHKSLQERHKAARHQQERMRNHINRLTELTQNRSNELQVKRLQEFGSQLQSENIMLKNQIAVLERQLSRVATNPNSNTSNTCTSNSSNDNSNNMEELIQCLRLQTEQLQNEIEQLQKQLNTCNLLKTSESEKLRKTESQLAEREMELDNLRAVNAKLKFDFEDLQLKLKEAGIELETLVDCEEEGDYEEDQQDKQEEVKDKEDNEENNKRPRLEAVENSPRSMSPDSLMLLAAIDEEANNIIRNNNNSVSQPKQVYVRSQPSECNQQ